MTVLCPGRVVVTLNPQASSTQWEAATDKGEDLELSTESPCELREPEPSPFSSKRTMYETEEVRPSLSPPQALVCVAFPAEPLSPRTPLPADGDPGGR